MSNATRNRVDMRLQAIVDRTGWKIHSVAYGGQWRVPTPGATVKATAHLVERLLHANAETCENDVPIRVEFRCPGHHVLVADVDFAYTGRVLNWMSWPVEAQDEIELGPHRRWWLNRIKSMPWICQD